MRTLQRKERGELALDHAEWGENAGREVLRIVVDGVAGWTILEITKPAIRELGYVVFAGDVQQAWPRVEVETREGAAALLSGATRDAEIVAMWDEWHEAVRGEDYDAHRGVVDLAAWRARRQQQQASTDA